MNPMYSQTLMDTQSVGADQCQFAVKHPEMQVVGGPQRELFLSTAPLWLHLSKKLFT